MKQNRKVWSVRNPSRALFIFWLRPGTPSAGRAANPTTLGLRQAQQRPEACAKPTVGKPPTIHSTRTTSSTRRASVTQSSLTSTSTRLSFLSGDPRGLLPPESLLFESLLPHSPDCEPLSCYKFALFCSFEQRAV